MWSARQGMLPVNWRWAMCLLPELLIAPALVLPVQRQVPWLWG